MLLVDDEPGILDVNSEGLGGAGYEVFTASNGEQALGILGQTPVDLIVSDMKMPGLSGFEFLQELNGRKFDIPVIFLTGYGTIDNAVECMQHGAADYLLKPFSFDTLIAKIKKALQERMLKRYDTAITDLIRIMNLERELKKQVDEAGLLKQFLQHVRGTFEPDALVFFLEDGDGKLTPFFTWGGMFKKKAPLQWFSALSETALRSDQPRLLDPQSSLAENTPRDLLQCYDPRAHSSLVTPVRGFLGKDGAMCLARTNGKGHFSFTDLQLLSIFASHAGAAAGFHRTCNRIKKMNSEIVHSYVQAVEARDVYTKGHSVCVRNYSLQLGKKLNLGATELQDLASAALLHDIGKIGIPDQILNKPNRLSAEELVIMRQHTKIGRDILAGVHSLHNVLPAIYHHHERYDGMGYPDALKGEEIPLLSRIIQVVDGFEAMTADRAYQRARPVEEALKVLEDGRGAQWDPGIVDAWVELVRETGLEPKHTFTGSELLATG